MKYSETFTSVTATYVNFNVYIPSVMIRYKAIVQIHHALGEYSGRYERFAEYLAHEGFVVVVSDFPGHGTSLYNYEQGYFGTGDPMETLVEDMQRLRNIMAYHYPDLPYFILGNQFGSLVLRKYICRYGDFVQGAIFMATCGRLKPSALSKLIIKGDTLIKGSMHRSKTVHRKVINRLICANENITYENGDKYEKKLYLQDPFTDFIYPNNAYNVLFKMIKDVTAIENIKKIPDYLSVLITSGKQDPFGQNGQGPTWLYQTLKNQGLRDISINLYDHSHQDILHDTERKIVYKDILDWLNERTFI